MPKDSSPNDTKVAAAAYSIYSQISKQDIMLSSPSAITGSKYHIRYDVDQRNKLA